MLKICQFGAGRIGKIHADNIARNPRTQLVAVVDVHRESAEDLAKQHGAAVGEGLAALDGADAVVIASSTDTHADLIEAAAKAGKAIFCEKPIDLDSARVEGCLDIVAQSGVPLALGFNRRFDPSFEAVHAGIAEGRIGKVELVAITSRDPGPPPASYIRVSGGLFRDMMIHDFDIARWLLGEEPVEIYATASNLVDPAIGAEGDVDTAVVTLKTAGGAIAQISNSRRAVYGYDQRVEAFGSLGMLRAENRAATTVEYAGADGVVRDKPLHFFLERYADAYRRELDDFIDAVLEGRAPRAGGEDGKRALLLADAAWESVKTGVPVRLSR